MEENEHRRQDRICRVATKDKFLSFENGLVVALPEHYAMLHGQGGKNFAAKSVIKLRATDYGKNPSITVSANVEPEIPSIWEDIALRNIGDIVVPMDAPGLWKLLAKAERAASGAKAAIATLFSTAKEIVTEVYRGKRTKEELIIATGKSLNACAASLETEGADKMLSMPYSFGYNYKAERVSPYQKSPDGKNFVTSLQVVRNGYRNTGEVAKMPWAITIKNFWADPKEAENGTISYKPGTESTLEGYEKKEVFIMVSDADMYNACHRVNSFIRVWENATCTAYVRNGVRDKEVERVNKLSQSYNPNE